MAAFQDKPFPPSLHLPHCCPVTASPQFPCLGWQPGPSAAQIDLQSPLCPNQSPTRGHPISDHHPSTPRPHCLAAHSFSGCTKQLRPIPILPCDTPSAHTPPSPTFPCGAPSQLSRTSLGLQERGFVTIGLGGDTGVGRISMVQVCTSGITVLCPCPGQEEHLILPGHSHLSLRSAAVWAEDGQTGPVG